MVLLFFFFFFFVVVVVAVMVVAAVVVACFWGGAVCGNSRKHLKNISLGKNKCVDNNMITVDTRNPGQKFREPLK